MRVFIFNIEHYVDFENESQNFLARLPIIHCGLPIEHFDYVHQRILRTKGREVAEAEALRAVQAFAPDVVVYFQAWRDEDLHPAVFAQIREWRIPIISFIWDSNLHPRWNEMLLFQNSDALVIVDSIDAYLRWRVLAQMLESRKTIVFGAGRYFVPQSDQVYEKLYDVSLLGTIEGDRAGLLASLNSRLREMGITFLHAGGMSAGNETKRWLTWEEYDAIIRQSRLCISSQTATNRRHIKGKIFESLARGTPCLIDNNSENCRLFPPDVAIYFEDFDNCVEQIRYYLEHEVERQNIALNASRWLSENFSYKDFYSRLLTHIVNKTGNPPVVHGLQKHFERLWDERYTMLPVLADVVTSLIKFDEQTGGRQFADPFNHA